MKTIIGKLFQIEYGQKEYENKTPLEGEDGNGILISSKGEDNGVYGFFDIKPKYKAPFITVPRVGTIGQAFVQTRDCSVDNNCLVLIPLEPMEMNDLYSIAFQIRNNSWKYKYGRQITPTRISAQEVYLSELNIDSLEYEHQITPPRTSLESLTHPGSTTTFKLKDLLQVERGKGSYLENLGDGNTPIVSTQSANNGICGFYDIEPIFKKHCITIGRITCNPRVQLSDFATVPDDMYVLIPKNEMSLQMLFYIAAIIANESWRFNYSRKVTKSKLEKIDIPLPVVKQEIDLDYINSIASNSYGFTTISTN